jgi:small subunit ribosomal protein S15
LDRFRLPSGQPDENGRAGNRLVLQSRTRGSRESAARYTEIMSEIVNKTEVITQYKVHEKDTGSCEVQVALLSARISHLTDHLRVHRKDFHSRRGLLALASRRRKLLDYLKRHDLARYNELLQRLGLRK